MITLAYHLIGKNRNNCFESEQCNTNLNQAKTSNPSWTAKELECTMQWNYLIKFLLAHYVNFFSLVALISNIKISRTKKHCNSTYCWVVCKFKHTVTFLQKISMKSLIIQKLSLLMLILWQPSKSM